MRLGNAWEREGWRHTETLESRQEAENTFWDMEYQHTGTHCNPTIWIRGSLDGIKQAEIGM